MKRVWNEEKQGFDYVEESTSAVENTALPVSIQLDRPQYDRMVALVTADGFKPQGDNARGKQAQMTREVRQIVVRLIDAYIAGRSKTASK